MILALEYPSQVQLTTLDSQHILDLAKFKVQDVCRSTEHRNPDINH